MKRFFKTLPACGLGLLAALGMSVNIMASDTGNQDLMKKPSPLDGSNLLVLDITVENPGELQSHITYSGSLIGGISVSGPINAAGFETLWKYSYSWSLREVLLENANAEGNVVPDYAFFHLQDQYDPEAGFFKPDKLYSITLPSNVEEIGKFAFGYAMNLEIIGLPSTLKRIGASAFLNCRSLTLDSFTLPDGLEEIGDRAFMYCYGLTGTAELPGSLKSVGSGAFYLTGIDVSSMPEGLEYLGSDAFVGCGLKEVILPDNCKLDKGGYQFADNRCLKSIHLPANLTTVPEACLKNCVELVDVDFPLDATSIEDEAFAGCTNLTRVILPDKIESLGWAAFMNCRNVQEIHLPKSTNKLWPQCFNGCENVNAIYCEAVNPPVCKWDAFEGVDPETPVYIPKGSKIGYEAAADAWKRFSNFIEVDFSGIVDVTADIPADGDGRIYDIMGRQVMNPVDKQLYIGDGKKFIYQSGR